MTLREWCQREGHPYVTHIYVDHPGEPFESYGKACICGQRHEPLADGRGYRVLDPHAVDAEGPDRTERSPERVQGA